MERNIGVERLYNLGQFKNIRFIDTFDNIPDYLWKNDEFISGMYRYLLLNVERQFALYNELGKELSELEFEERLEKLEEMRSREFAKIVELLDNEANLESNNNATEGRE